jgi:hypothetical protein
LEEIEVTWFRLEELKRKKWSNEQNKRAGCTSAKCNSTGEAGQ